VNLHTQCNLYNYKIHRQKDEKSGKKNEGFFVTQKKSADSLYTIIPQHVFDLDIINQPKPGTP
jgi:hypothetical protein